MSISVSSILGVLFALALTILSYIFIIPEKRKDRLNGFFKFIHNVFNFKSLLLEKIVQAMYVFSTLFVIVYGFFLLFSFETQSVRYGNGFSGYYYKTEKEWVGYVGFFVIIFGPIIVRIIYEFTMMIILLVKNVMQINNKLANQNPDNNSYNNKHNTYNANQYNGYNFNGNQQNGYTAYNCYQNVPDQSRANNGTRADYQPNANIYANNQGMNVEAPINSTPTETFTGVKEDNGTNQN